MIQEQAAEHVAKPAAEGFDAGKVIIEHVSNSGHEHPLIRLPHVLGIDFSVTKHVLMLWLVAAFLFVVITWVVRRHLKKDRDGVPTGALNALEIVVEYIRDRIVAPNTWTPLLLTFFFFILCANAAGLVPIFDVIGLLNHWVFHTDPGTFLGRVVHGGTTATANFNVTAGLATVTFFAIIVAGSKAHGFVRHWINIVPPGLAWPLYILLIPIELIGMLARPFALTMRLAANMTGGHIAILVLLSFVFLFTGVFHHAMVGIGVGVFVSVPLAVAISALEIVVVLVQAYVFTLLSAVFIGMAIHAHH
jgi:F-type H+-transporting ATPase subunit a